MKKFILGLLSGLLITTACAMSQRSKRLTSDVDSSNLHWYNATEKMVADPAGKLCLVKCKLELQKDGTCKKDQYLYECKDHKANHEFFKGWVMVPMNQVF